MMRYVYCVTDGRMHDVRCVAVDYELAHGELEGYADRLPEVPTLTPPRAPTLDDVIAVLTPEQRAALQAKANAEQ